MDDLAWSADAPDEGPPSPALPSESVLPSQAPGLQATPTTPAVPARVGEFEIRGVLGRGGMGIVYRAWDPRLEREVALKVVAGEHDERRLARFEREGRITANLSHPGILTVHAAGQADGQPYLAYELIEGARTFEDELGELTLAERLERVIEVGRALGHGHARGVTHRDVKPENVLITADGSARMADYGLAVALDVERLTQTGTMLGTPYYMAPEQLRGERDAVGPASDVWSLGVVLYQALTDTLPFQADSLGKLALAINGSDPVPPDQLAPEVPAQVSAVCLRALRKDPAQRYPDGDALVEALEQALQPASPVRRGAFALAGFGLVLLLGVMLEARSNSADPDAGTSAPPASALRLVIEAPTAAVEVWDEAVFVRGRLEESAAEPSSSEPSSTESAQQVTVRVEPGAPFERRVRLQPEARVLRVVARTADRREAVAIVRLRRVDVPAWFRALPKHQAPALPLPSGLRFGSSPGEYVYEVDGSVLVWIYPGSFEMGRTNSVGSTGPAHRVTIRRGYFLGKYELSFEQFDRYCAAVGLNKVKPAFLVNEQHPVHLVSWDAAMAYCAWAGLRLPSEAEWEYAARGEGSGPYPWGDAFPTDARARQHPHAKLPGNAVEEPERKTRPVREGVAGASPFGCLNMAGNVWEWTHDWFVGYSGRARTDPIGHDPETAPPPLLSRFRRTRRTRSLIRCARGGSFRTSDPLIRVYHRDAFRPISRRNDLGFRVVLDPRPPPSPAFRPTWSVRFFSWTQDPVEAPERWRAEAGDAASRSPHLRFYLRSGSPTAGVTQDRFGTLATATVTLPPGDHTLACVADDGVRVYVDEQLVIDRWKDNAPTKVDRVRLPSGGGEQVIRVEHFERLGQATLFVWLEPGWRP